MRSQMRKFRSARVRYNFLAFLNRRQSRWIRVADNALENWECTQSRYGKWPKIQVNNHV